MFDWTNENSGVLALVVPFVLAGFGYVTALTRGVDIERKLLDPASRAALIARFYGTGEDAYFGALGRLLGNARGFMGTRRCRGMPTVHA